MRYIYQNKKLEKHSTNEKKQYQEKHWHPTSTSNISAKFTIKFDRKTASKCFLYYI